MRASALGLCCALLLCSTPALAEPTTVAEPAWTIQVDPLTTALGFVHLQIERRLGDSWSVYAGPHARLFRGILAEDDEDNRGVGIEVGLRWFFRGGAPAGWWAQVRFVAARVTKDSEAELGGYVSALGGYTWIFGGRWVVAAGLGVQYLHYSVGDIGIKGVAPAAHSAFGISF